MYDQCLTHYKPCVATCMPLRSSPGQNASRTLDAQCIRVVQHVSMVKTRRLTARRWALISIFAASLVLATLSLVTARGVVLVDPPSSYETEFADPGWAWAALILAVPIAAVSYRWPGITTFHAIAVALLPQIWLAVQYNINAAAAGWTGPFDLLAFVWPMMAFAVYGLAAALVAGITGPAIAAERDKQQQH
jgi:hypothetical protein